MKNINKYIALIIFGGLLVFSSCETFELDKVDDPNFLTPPQANADFFLNGIQEDFVRQIEGDADFDPNDNWESGGNTNGDGLSLFGGEMTRLVNMSGRNYASVYQGSDSDDEWTNMYAGVMTDIRAMNEIATAEGFNKHIAIGQFIEAYLISAMVDFYGDIPYSEIGLGAENFNPKLDDGASVYEAALTLLDTAITNFEADIDSNIEPAIDVFYGKDYDNWINAANTLKMRLYMQRRLVDANALTSINTILASGNYIQDSADDFQYTWPGATATQPDTRHPRYGLNYQAAGAGDYMSNWLMNLMTTTDDPRVRYYFYRQTNAVPGQEIDPDEETLQCSLQTAPQHYIAGGFTFCNLPNGFWGRDHGDPAGIPPDGLLRTTFGVYPVGGRFDDDSFAEIAPGDGGSGNGITPILTAAWVDFMQAEMAMLNGAPGDARTFIEAGLAKQIAKVQTFASLDSGADKSLEPSASDVSDFITSIGNAFTAANDEGKWNILAEQYFVSSFGNGIETYNFYRRTGYPTTLQPNLEPNPGTFIRSLFYPANAVNTNSNISQKDDQTQAVFWDTNPNAPVAN